MYHARPGRALVAHISVALTEDRRSVLAAGHQMLDFYAKMFSDAGFALTSDQTVPDALVEFGNLRK
jgi:hypothetical protein